MEERNERDARVTRSNQEHFHSIKKTVFVPYISLFYRVRGLRKERIKIEGVAPLGKEEVMDGYRNPSGCLHAFSYSRR